MAKTGQESLSTSSVKSNPSNNYPKKSLFVFSIFMPISIGSLILFAVKAPLRNASLWPITVERAKKICKQTPQDAELMLRKQQLESFEGVPMGLRK